MHHTRLAAAALALAAGTTTLIASCSSSNHHTATPSAPAATASGGDATDRAALTQAVNRYLTAVFTDDVDTAYDGMSARCAGLQTRDATAAQLQGVQQTYGRLTVKSMSIDQISGDLARVSYDVGVPAVRRTGTPWTREGGQWKYDAC
jgi:hypothetical protein